MLVTSAIGYGVDVLVAVMNTDEIDVRVLAMDGVDAWF